MLQAAFAVFLRVSSETPPDACSSSAFHSAFSYQSCSTLVLHSAVPSSYQVLHSAVFSQVPSGIKLDHIFYIHHLFLYNCFHQMMTGCCPIPRRCRILMFCSIA
ncbi:unnamed protein product [Victoria cruziana]